MTTNRILHSSGSHERRTVRRERAKSGALSNLSDFVPRGSLFYQPESAQGRGLAFWQTNSNAIILDDSVPADCHHQSTGKQVVDHVTIRPEVDLRCPGVPHEEVQQDSENSRKRFFGRVVHEIMHHSNKDALTAELQSNSPYTLLKEESKQMIHTQGNDKELCQISETIQCPQCMKKIDGRNCVL